MGTRRIIIALLKIALVTTLIILLSASTFFGILFLGGFGKIPSKKDLNDLKNQSASLVYSSDDVIIGKFYTENRTIIPFNKIPENLIHALIATEDSRFYEHTGIDGKSLVRVLIKTILLKNERSGGGSTLSQQLAKNLYGRKNYGKVTLLVNKLKEIILANRLENTYTKEQILALYLNTVTFGENTYGIEVASHRYFDKEAIHLKTEESAVLVGLLKANTYYNPRLYPDHSLFRRNVVLSQMNKYDYLQQKESDSLKSLPLELSYTNISKLDQTAYFLSQVRSESQKIINSYNQANNTNYKLKSDGLKVKTILNFGLQKSALKAMEMHLSKMQELINKQYKRNPSKAVLSSLTTNLAGKEKIDLSDTSKEARFIFNWDDDHAPKKLSIQDSIKHILKQLHAGVIGLDPKSGAIRTYVGGISHQYYPYDQIKAKRQLASTFKPILYASALESGFNSCDYLSNEEIILTDYNNWSPKNYDKETGGKYSFAAALAYSKNIPTLRLFFEVEWVKLERIWADMGFETPLSQDPSVIYGTNSVSLLELATAYSAFSNGGYKINPYSISTIETKDGELLYNHRDEKLKRIISSETALTINEILNKAIREGTGIAIPNKYGIKYPFAGKTGTSQNYADAWFCIYNKDIVLASRVGASYPSIHFDNGGFGSGSRLALPLIGKTLELEKDKKWPKAGLEMTNSIDCPNFVENNGLDNLLNLFKKKETQISDEREKVRKKKKRKNLFNKVFGSD